MIILVIMGAHYILLALNGEKIVRGLSDKTTNNLGPRYSSRDTIEITPFSKVNGRRGDVEVELSPRMREIG